MRYLVRTAINTLDLWLYMLLVPGISLHGLDNNRDITLCLLAGGAVLGIISCLVRPTLMILPISLYILTLGLLFLIVNAAIFRLTATFIVGFDVGATVTTWMAATIGGILLPLFNIFADAILPEEYRRC